MLVGLISDTHGLLRPEALAALQGSQLIVHAGDIGKPEILDELRTIAPTFAVRGNNDSQAWAAALPEKEIVEVAGGQVWVLHQIAHLFRGAVGDRCVAVVFGHTHNAEVIDLPSGTYVNCGNWLRGSSYVEIDHGDVSLHTWNANRRAA